jgi:hypothetical protein
MPPRDDSPLFMNNPKDAVFIGVDLNLQAKKMVESVQSSFLDSPQLNLFHGAMSNVTGEVGIANCGDSFWEGCQIDIKSPQKAKVMTVESLVAELISKGTIQPRTKQRLFAIQKQEKRADTSNGKKKAYVIDVLKIDAEGSDPLVLQGAMSVLEAMTVRLLMFEYHQNCPWVLFSLKKIVDDLSKIGYMCYFVGQSGNWPLSDRFWNDAYEFHRWANVACVLRNDIWSSVWQSQIITRAHAEAYGKHNKDIHPEFRDNPSTATKILACSL